MKREEIKTLIPEITKEALDAIMDMNGKDIEAAKANITALTTERDGLKAQLADANTAIQSYKDMDIEGVKQSVKDWETKYNTDTQKLKDDLAAANYGFAVERAVSGLKFTSESAKKAFVADLTGKKLPVQEGKLLGLEDFTKTYRETDPGAFAPADDDKTPIFSRGGGGGGTPGSNDALRAAFGLTTKKE